jgi:lysophospholipase L1-like esterase
MGFFYKYLFLIVILSVFNACGNGGLTKTENGSLQKIDRADWSGVEESVRGFSITDDANLLSFKIESDLISDGLVGTEVIFIDADNDPNTGYNSSRWEAQLGAEYLIEGSRIYSYAGSGWSWNLIGEIDRNYLNDRELEVEFSKDLINNPSDIRATTYLLNDQFGVIERYESVTYIMRGLQNSLFQAEDKGDRIEFRMRDEAIVENLVRTQVIFIDADNDPNTGYSSSRWGNVGAEYLVEGRNVYSYGGSGWSWDRIGRVDRVQNGDTITISIDKNGLILFRTVRLNSAILDDNYRPINRFDEITTNVTLNDGFDEVRAILSSGNATYICIGDSTRAEDDNYQGGLVFEIISQTLSNYGVNSILEATPGRTASQWNDENFWLNYQDTINSIPGDGSNTIVDIVLGINDTRMGDSVEDIKSTIYSAIDKILQERPRTIFMLTMPNEMVGMDIENSKIYQLYIEISQERGYPLVNTHDTVFAGDGVDLTLYSDRDIERYGGEIRIHMSDEGQRRVAREVLRHIEP